MTEDVAHDVVVAPRVVRWMIRLVGVIIGVSVVAGVAAASVGRELTDLGDGAGGLFGIPSLLLLLIATVLGIPAAVIAGRVVRPDDGWIGVAVLVGLGVWVVAIGYFGVAHALDPCANGWWDGRTRIGSQPLCERFGPDLNWHARFHLLAHALPAAALFGLYAWAVRRSPVGRGATGSSPTAAQNRRGSRR